MTQTSHLREIKPVKKVQELFATNEEYVRCRCKIQVWVATHWMTFAFLALFAIGLILALQVITLIEIIHGEKRL